MSLALAGRFLTTEPQGKSHMPLLKFMGGVLWGSLTKAGLVNSNPKSKVLVSPMGVLSKWHIRKRHWNVEEMLVTGLLGKPYLELTFTCDSVCRYLGHLLA